MEARVISGNMQEPYAFCHPGEEKTPVSDETLGGHSIQGGRRCYGNRAQAWSLGTFYPHHLPPLSRIPQTCHSHLITYSSITDPNKHFSWDPPSSFHCRFIYSINVYQALPMGHELCDRLWTQTGKR